MEPRLIDDLAKRLASRLPEGMSELHDDLQANFKAVLQSALGKLDLVTRREFDIQQKVLERSRERLEELLARVDELEAQLDDSDADQAG